MPGTGEEFGPCPHCGQLHNEDVLLCPKSEKLLPLEGRILDGKFRFVKMLGEGGMGTVWMATNVLVKKTVAIKLMHVQFSRDEGVLARFRNEATAAGRIGSKHICDILDLGKSTLGPYIVMEMLSGSDFAEFCQKRSPVDIGTVVMVMRQALIGLGAAHEAGIVHRDLKPENVFLHEPEPGKLLVKLMDFGISKFTEGSEAGKTGMGVLMGTPEYMSPEQTEGAAQVDLRTDIWAMGVIMYWALAGKNPFAGPTMAATLMNVSMREAPPLGQVAPHVPAQLVDVVDRCLYKPPDERWPSARALSDALAPFENADGGIFTPHETKAAITPPPGTPRAGGTVATPAPQAASSPTPQGTPTWAGQVSSAPIGTAPTISGASDFSAVSDDFGRPDTNIGGGKGGLIFGALLAIAAIGGGGWWLYQRSQVPTDDDTVVAKASADDSGDEPVKVAGKGKAGGDDGEAADEGKADEAGDAADEGKAADEVGDVADEGKAADEAGDAADEGKAADEGVDDGGADAADEGKAADEGADAGDEGKAADEGGADEGGADGADDGGAADGGKADGGKSSGGGGGGGGGGRTSGGGGRTSGGGGGGKTSGGGGGGNGGNGGNTPRIDPAKVDKSNSGFYVLRRTGRASSHGAAKSFCRGKGKDGGVPKRWSLPKLGQAKKSRVKEVWLVSGKVLGPRGKGAKAKASKTYRVVCVSPRS